MTPPSTATGLTFSDVDQSGNDDFFVDYLDTVRSAPSIRQIDEKILEIVAAQHPGLIVEIGCGTGDLLATLSAVSNPPARGVGVEKSAALTEEACRRHRARAHLDFIVHDFMEATESPQLAARGLALGTADALVLNRVVQHLPEPVKLLGNARPWLRPGGVAVISDVDWTQLSIRHENTALTGRILAEHVGYLANAKAGSVSGDLLAEAGFSEAKVSLAVTHEISEFGLANKLFSLSFAVDRLVSKGELTAEAGSEWLLSCAQLEREGRFFASVFQSVVFAVA